MARVVRPDAREYSVSPTPTMQYLSRSPRLWTTISWVPPQNMRASAGGAQPRDRLRRARRDIRRPRDATTLPPTVSLGCEARRERSWGHTRRTGIALRVAVRLFVQAGVQIGHDLDRAVEAGGELGQLGPGAVDLGAEPLAFLLEHVRFVPEPLVVLLHRSGLR